MAWAFSANRGSGISQASGTTVTANTTAGIPAGDFLFVFYTGDNDGTLGGINTTNALRVSDNAGLSANRWIKLIQQENDPGAANAGILGAIFMCQPSVTIPSGTTITVTLGTARTAKAITLEHFTCATGFTWKGAGGTGTTGTGTTNPTSGTLNLGTAPATSRLWLGLCAREGDNDETITQDATYTSLGSSGKFGTPNLATTSNASGVVGYRISSSDTSKDYVPDIGTSRDWSTMLVALDEVPRSRYAEFVLSLSPRGYWRMGELAGAVCFDYAGQNPGAYGSNGGSHTYNSTSALTSDESGDGGHLFTRGTSATGPYVTVPDHNDLDLGDGPMTWMAWHQFTGTPDINQPLIDKFTNAYMGLWWNLSNTRYQFSQSQVGLLIEESSTTADTNYHFMVTSMAAGTGFAIYKDGTSNGGSPTDRTLSNNSSNLTFGTENDHAAFNTQRMDEIAGFATQLTADQIAAIYNIGIGKYQRPYRNPMPPLIAQ